MRRLEVLPERDLVDGLNQKGCCNIENTLGPLPSLEYEREGPPLAYSKNVPTFSSTPRSWNTSIFYDLHNSSFPRLTRDTRACSRVKNDRGVWLI